MFGRDVHIGTASLSAINRFAASPRLRRGGNNCRNSAFEKTTQGYKQEVETQGRPVKNSKLVFYVPKRVFWVTPRGICKRQAPLPVGIN